MGVQLGVQRREPELLLDQVRREVERIERLVCGRVGGVGHAIERSPAVRQCPGTQCRPEEALGELTESADLLKRSSYRVERVEVPR
jgi:hypothetical protein